MKTKNFLTSSFVVALASATICAPAANAAPLEAEVNNQSQTQSDNLLFGTLSDFERIAQVSEENFKAEIQLIDSSGSEALEVTDSKETIEEILKKAGYEPTDYRTSENSPITDEIKIKSGDTVNLFKSEISGSSKVIKMKAPVERVETDDLFEGEEEVKEKGSDGEALKTIVSTKNLANDSKINDSASENKGSVSSTIEEKLTILKTPKAKVILVGTKERAVEDLQTPSPEIERTALESRASSNSTPTYNENSSETSRANNSTVSRNSSSSNRSSSSSSNYSSPKPAKVELNLGNDGAESSISKTAKAQLGKPYIWGATGPSAFDCSGFIYWVNAQHGKSVPRTSGGQWAAATPISGSQLRAGDILWKPGHIALYVGNGKVVHASSPKTGVISGTASDMLSRGYKAGRL